MGLAKKESEEGRRALAELCQAYYEPVVAFLRWEGSLQCSHVEIAAVDGSQASSPERIYDCATEGRFLSDLAWITR